MTDKKILTAAFLAFTLVWFALLAWRPLYDPDEGRYAEIPREMLLSGDWVIPHLNGLAYLEKPPLQYWLTAMTFKLFGANEFTARFCTGLAGYATLLIVFALGRSIWDTRTGLIAAAFTAGSSLFTLMAHQLTLDMTLSFWLFAALACFVQANLRRGQRRAPLRWMLGCWVAMAGAVLTKGLIGALIPAASLGIYALIQRDVAACRELNLRWGLPVFGIIVAPWFVLAARANPDFLNLFFIREHFQRFLTTIEQRVEPWWYFAAVLLIGVLPWFPQALCALIQDWRVRSARGTFDPVRLFWVWSVFVFLFFSASNSKLIPYLLPLVPVLALLCARPDARCGSRAAACSIALCSMAALGVWLYLAGVWSTHAGQQIADDFRVSLTAMAVALSGSALVACVFLIRKHRGSVVLLTLALGWFAADMFVLAGSERGDALYSARDLARVLAAQAGSDAAIFSVQCYDQTIPFYAKRVVTLVAYRGELDLGLTQAPRQGIASLQRFATQWRDLDQGYAVIQVRAFERIAASGLPMRELSRNPNLVLVARR